MRKNVLVAVAAVVFVFHRRAASASDFALPLPTSILSSMPAADIPVVPPPVVVPAPIPAGTQGRRPSPRPNPGSRVTKPDEGMTPGALCTSEDPNFQEYRYPEGIAYCRRNVPQEVKRRIAEAYGVPWEDRQNYEFDHRIPLCMGGNDDSKNIWPQPLDEALEKDKLENALCRQLSAGEITQRDAVAQMLNWSN